MSGELRRLRLRYPATCVLCGAALAKGAEALYDSGSKTARCLVCQTSPSGDELSGIDVGVAGRSAEREFERRHAQREERVRKRFGRRLGDVVLALSSDPQTTTAWDHGARGEQELATILSTVPQVLVLSDRRVHGTDGNIDHIVIGPAGVFVVDAKDHRGEVHIVERGGLFRSDPRLYIDRRDCSRLADGMAWQVDAVVRFLKSVNLQLLPPVTPVLCFVEARWPLFSAPNLYRGVRIEGRRSIKKLVASGSLLATDDRAHLAGMLARAFPAK